MRGFSPATRAQRSSTPGFPKVKDTHCSSPWKLAANADSQAPPTLHHAQVKDARSTGSCALRATQKTFLQEQLRLPNREHLFCLTHGVAFTE